MKKPISQKQSLALRAQAHHLKPVVLLGDKGLTDNVVLETEAALLAHELIKVKINSADRDERKTIAAELAARTDSHTVQIIGRTVVLYKKNENK